MFTLSAAQARCEWMEVSTVFSRSYDTRVARTLCTLPGAGNRTLVEA